jgi:tetratricopeptide (TPR) repeat protein
MHKPHRLPIAVLAAFATATSLSPAPAGAQTHQYRALGGALYVSQPDTGAVARAESAVVADTSNIDLLLALGLAEAGIRRYREAITTFTTAIARAPDNAALFRWRGHRYLSVREFGRARADLERGLQLDSTCYGCLYHLGVVRYVTGDFVGAADAFQRGLPLAPEAAETAGSIDWSWMSLMRAGRPADAQAVLDRNADSLPVENAYTRRLRLYRGQIGPAQVVTPADTSDVDLATLSYGLGNWYLLRGDTALAREWFGRAVASGGWPAFGFIAAEAEFRRLR